MNEGVHFNKAIEIDKFDIDIDINILLSGCVCTVLKRQDSIIPSFVYCITVNVVTCM